MRLLTRVLFSLRITAARTARPRGSGAGRRGPASDRAGVWGGAPPNKGGLFMSGLLATMLVQNDSDGSAVLAAFGLGFSLFVLAISILMIAAIWGVFSKAGQPGWAAIIPIYNVIVWLKVAGKP